MILFLKQTTVPPVTQGKSLHLSEPVSSHRLSEDCKSAYEPAHLAPGAEAWGSSLLEESEPQTWCDRKCEGSGLMNQLLEQESDPPSAGRCYRAIHRLYVVALTGPH